VSSSATSLPAGKWRQGSSGEGVMKWMIASLLAVTLLVLPPESVSAGSCPEAFHLHDVGDDHEHGDHRHVGPSRATVDRNGNGLICVKHVTPDGDIHVHIDDLTR
jgi:hypothetical protein